MKVPSNLIDNFGSRGSVAGIGSRRLPKKESHFLFTAAAILTLMGYKFSSGAADGSDTSVEIGALAAIDIAFLLQDVSRNNKGDAIGNVLSVYLPWNNFNGRNTGPGYIDSIPADALHVTAKFHPGWPSLNDRVRRLMSRNACQILGIGLNVDTYSKFVLCYTPDKATTGEETSSATGGTGQAIRIGSSYNIPVFNIARDDHRERISTLIHQFSVDFNLHYNVDLLNMIDDYYHSYVGVKNFSKMNIGEFYDSAKTNTVIFNEMNCKSDYSSPRIRALFSKFPEAMNADAKFSLVGEKRLGKFSFAEVNRDGRSIVIVNAYSQVSAKPVGDELLIDYETFRKMVAPIVKQFKQKNVLINKVGQDGNGCWLTLSNRINEDFKGRNIIVADHDGSDLSSHISNELFLSRPSKIDPDKSVFFHGSNHIWSQWNYSPFKADGVLFYTCEQFMMFKKAALFADVKMMEYLMFEKDPRECKRLGRLVSGFSDAVWDSNCERIVFSGNVYKFTQNPSYLSKLLSNRHKEFIEASKTDKIWGVGLDEHDPKILDRSKWRGENKLGRCLNAVADHIMKNHASIDMPEQSRRIVERFISGQENDLIASAHSPDQMGFF